MDKKFAVVTGASTGIGRAVSVELGKLGWKIALVGRNEDGLIATGELVNKSGGESVVFPADLTNANNVEQLISQISAETNQIDLIANIAGIWHGDGEVYAGKNLEDFGGKVIRDTFEVGLIAPAMLVAGLIRMMPNGSSVINLSGTFENGGKGWIPYYASKRGIEDLTIGLAEELKEKGIKVNCVSPSDTATEEYKKFFPEDAEGAQTPEQVAKLFIDLLDKDVTGKVFVVKNGEVSENFHK